MGPSLSATRPWFVMEPIEANDDGLIRCEWQMAEQVAHGLRGQLSQPTLL
jgi:hypothetical protein